MQNRRVGPYRLVRRLGSGGFGEVWLADREGELATTRLAVKLPHPGMIDVAAIRQEAVLWAAVSNHPNVVPLFEANVYDGQVVIAAEYAAGGSLADWLGRHGGMAPSWQAACGMAGGILAGLAHLHANGIIHRDIKPANVLLQGHSPRLADFGISRALSGTDTSQRPAGTPSYMAPEAFDGVRSAQTDLWAVGVVLYQLLTGQLPFPQREWTAVMKAVLTTDPAPIPESVPAAVRRIVDRCLARGPADRPTSAGELAAELAEVCHGTADVRLTVHDAAFAGTLRFAVFINVTNLSETTDRVITHVWIEAEEQVSVVNPDRPLPRRLKPQETWETWIDFSRLPAGISETFPECVRARLSTGEVLTAIFNRNVPSQGLIPGSEENERPTPASTPVKPSATRNRRWWKFW